MKVAVVEDSPHLSYQLKQMITEAGYLCESYKSKTEALNEIPIGEFDIIVLDINLPDGNGFEVCEVLRKQLPEILIIFLSVRDSIKDKIRGFESGADDYLSKPFDKAELLARIKALSKRQGRRKPDVMEIGDLLLDVDNQIISNRETNVHLQLSIKEFNILEHLVANQGLLVSRDRLADLAWDDPISVSENIVSVYIGKLRKKIRKLIGTELIETVTGRGYIIRS